MVPNVHLLVPVWWGRLWVLTYRKKGQAAKRPSWHTRQDLVCHTATMVHSNGGPVYGDNPRLKARLGKQRNMRAKIKSPLTLPLSCSQKEMKGRDDASTAPQRCWLYRQEREASSRLIFKYIIDCVFWVQNKDDYSNRLVLCLPQLFLSSQQRIYTEIRYTKSQLFRIGSVS